MTNHTASSLTAHTYDALARYEAAGLSAHTIQRNGVTALTAGRELKLLTLGGSGGLENNIITWAITTDQIDRANDRMNPGGVQIKRYLDNPVIPWGHNTDEPPIGRGLHPRFGVVDNGRKAVLLDIEFSRIGEFASEVHDLVVAGYINAGSIGFIPLTWTDEAATRYPEAYPYVDTVRTYQTWELLEFSLCTVPMNPGALVQHSMEMDASFDASIRDAVGKGIILPDGATIKRLFGGGRIPDIITSTKTMTIPDPAATVATVPDDATAAPAPDTNTTVPVVERAIAPTRESSAAALVTLKSQFDGAERPAACEAVDSVRWRLYCVINDCIWGDEHVPLEDRLAILEVELDGYRDFVIRTLRALLTTTNEADIVTTKSLIAAHAAVNFSEVVIDKAGRVLRTTLLNDLKTAIELTQGVVSEAEKGTAGEEDKSEEKGAEGEDGTEVASGIIAKTADGFELSGSLAGAIVAENPIQALATALGVDIEGFTKALAALAAPSMQAAQALAEATAAIDPDTIATDTTASVKAVPLTPDLAARLLAAIPVR